MYLDYHVIHFKYITILYLTKTQKYFFVVKMKSNSIYIFQGPMGGKSTVVLHHSVNRTIIFVLFF